MFNPFKKKEPEIPVTPPPRLTILVVDDEQYLREFYQELLSHEGYNVVTATNGKEGLDMVAKYKPSLIILDIQMPVMNGLEMAKNLKENSSTNTIPVILLTNAGSVINMEQAKFLNVSDFFIKSNVPPETIIFKVNGMLRPHKPADFT